MDNKNYTGFNRFFHSGTVQMLLNKRSDGTIREFLDDWKWVFSFSGRYRREILLYTLLGIFASSMSLGTAYVSRTLINIIAGGETEKLWLLIFAILLTTALFLVFNAAMSRLVARVSVCVNNDIQAKIYEKLLDARWEELNRCQSGDLLNRFNADVSAVSSNAIVWIPSLIVNLYTFGITFVVMLRLDAVMAGIALLSGPVLLVFSRIIMRKMREYRRRVLELNSDMMSFESETFSNFDAIKSFGITDFYARELHRWQEKYRQYNLNYNRFEIQTRVMMTLLSTAVSMLAFAYCLYRLWTGQILFGDMTFFLQQRETLSGRFKTMVGTFPDMINSAVSAHRIRELMEMEQEAHDPENLEKLRAVSRQGIAVEMHNASFAYGENRELYLNSDFTANPGEIVAVLGPSGEGKTTLLRLILGLILPQEGEVYLRSADGEAFPMNADLRCLIAYVPQGNSLMSGTIAENLRMVCEDASDEQLEDALRMACAWEFVQKLPEGIHTRLGDRGSGISMGQGQRLAIARALLRDCPILMLDEATSALDMETEKQVLQNIIRCQPNKTCIVSTHRTGVLAQCSRIYRIQGQKIVQIESVENVNETQV